MVSFPEITVAASKEAIRIWMNAVVPSLLPFMLIADYFKRHGAASLSGSGIYPVLMAFLSGYPMGAKVAGDSYREGLIDEKGLHRLLCYTMITGPAFLTGGVGITFYQSKAIGYILAWSHYAAAACCGIVLGRGFRLPQKTAALPGLSQSDTPFTDSVLKSFQTLGIVLAYMILFMIATDFPDQMGMMRQLPEEVSSLCKGILEMTVGCSEIAASQCNLTMKLTATSFVISFGGLSVIGQTMSMLSGCPVTFPEILKIKIVHGIFSAIWTFTICTFVV